MTVTLSFEMIMMAFGFLGIAIGVWSYFTNLKRKVEWLVEAHQSPDDYGFGSTQIISIQKEIQKNLLRMLALQVWVAEKQTGTKPPPWALKILNGGSDPAILIDN